MYTISSDEFALLNNEEKLEIVENLKNDIEFQKQKYFNYFKDEVPINHNIQSINYLEENNKTNELSSSNSSTINDNDNNNSNIIKQAKNNAIEIQKELEKLKNIKKYKMDDKKKEKEIKDELNNSDTVQEFNYIIESTTNSYDSTIKKGTDNNKYISNPLNIDYNKKYIDNYNINYKNKLKYNYNNNLLNYNNYNNNYIWNNLNKNIKLKKRIKDNHIFEEKKNDKHINKNKYDKNDNNLINFKIEDIRNKYNGNISSIRKNNNINNINDNENKLTKANDKNKLDLKGKFDKEYLFNNELFEYINKKKLKKNLSFSKNLNKDLNSNEKSRNRRKIIKYKSLNNINRIGPKDVSNRLYNMYQVIIDKINKKKEEIEKKELKNCSFIPKINNKSKKIMKKLEQENKTFLERKKEYENIFNNNNNDNIIKRKITENKYEYFGKPNINKKPNIFDLKPLYNKNINRINSYNKEGFEKLTNINKKINSNEELKECTFRPKINNNKNIINYRNSNMNYKYKTIDILNENKNISKNILNNNKYELDYLNYINRPTNIKQSFSLMNNQIDNYYSNNDQFNNIKKIKENNNHRLYKNIEKKNCKKDQLINYYNSIFDFRPKMNDDNYDNSDNINQYIISSRINNTESNINYFQDYGGIYKRPISSSRLKNNKITNSRSLKNIYYNYNKNNINPPNYGNNEEKKFQLDMIRMNNLDSYKPIYLKETENFDKNKNFILNQKSFENRNKNSLMSRKVLTINNSISFLKPIKKVSYQNNNNNNYIYIKKNVKNNNFSYSNRNSIFTINNNNSKLLNNRMLIQKLLLEEE